MYHVVNKTGAAGYIYNLVSVLAILAALSTVCYALSEYYRFDFFILILMIVGVGALVLGWLGVLVYNKRR